MCAAPVEELESREILLKLRQQTLVSNALQYLAEDQVRQPNRIACSVCIQPVRLCSLATTKVVDPNSAVDDSHDVGQLAKNTSSSTRFKVAFPGHLAAPFANARLALGPDQQVQRLFDHGPLGRLLAGAHRLRHQLVVDIDVGAHV